MQPLKGLSNLRSNLLNLKLVETKDFDINQVHSSVLFQTTCLKSFTKTVMLGSLITTVLSVFFYVMSAQYFWGVFAGLALGLLASAFAAHLLYYYHKNLQFSSRVLTISFHLIIGLTLFLIGPSQPIALLFIVPTLFNLALLPLGNLVGCALLSVLYTTTYYIINPLPFIQLDPTTAQVFTVLLWLVGLIAIFSLIGYLAIRFNRRSEALELQCRTLQHSLSQSYNRQKSLNDLHLQVSQFSSELESLVSNQFEHVESQSGSLAQINSAVAELASIGSNIGAFVNGVNNLVQDMASNSSKIEDTSEKVVAQSKRGIEATVQTNRNCNEVVALYEQLVVMFKALQDRSAATRRILELLNSISGETHLLSLNAMIEAVGANSPRFEVVAKEVSQLAQRATKAQEEIKKIIHEIDERTTLVVSSVEEGYRQTQALHREVETTSSAMVKLRQMILEAQRQSKAINQQSQKVRELVEMVTNSTTEQSNANVQILSGIRALSESSYIQVSNQQRMIEKVKGIQQLVAGVNHV